MWDPILVSSVLITGRYPPRQKRQVEESLQGAPDAKNSQNALPPDSITSWAQERAARSHSPCRNRGGRPGAFLGGFAAGPEPAKIGQLGHIQREQCANSR
jgi:hypothetical protein